MTESVCLFDSLRDLFHAVQYERWLGRVYGKIEEHEMTVKAMLTAYAIDRGLSWRPTNA